MQEQVVTCQRYHFQFLILLFLFLQDVKNAAGSQDDTLEFQHEYIMRGKRGMVDIESYSSDELGGHPGSPPFSPSISPSPPPPPPRRWTHLMQARKNRQVRKSYFKSMNIIEIYQYDFKFQLLKSCA